MTDDMQREAFERWIALPPYEHDCKRYTEAGPWPGAYKRYETELAWEAWQAAIRHMREQEEKA